jgi:hypothetical protein
LASRKSRKVARKAHPKSDNNSQGNHQTSSSKDSIKAAEDLALAAFASGLKLAAAFGTVAAKTTSLALTSIAIGANRFSELVKQEAMKSQKANSHKTARVSRARGSKRAVKREPKREILAS